MPEAAAEVPIPAPVDVAAVPQAEEVPERGLPAEAKAVVRDVRADLVTELADLEMGSVSSRQSRRSLY